VGSKGVIRLLGVLIVVGVLAGCGRAAGPKIEATEAWARPAMATGAMEPGGGMASGQGMGGTGAVFVRLTNAGDEADRLVGGQTDVAKVVEIHETVMEGEVMKMRMLADGLEIPARGQVELKPGGYHVMLIGLERDLEVGDRFSLELQFEKSGSLSLRPEVRQP
jgi:periplasmic copper chaperone A